MIVFLTAFGTALATLLGGGVALRFQNKFYLILGFSAGAVVGVAFFDLLPEALRLGRPHYTDQKITALVAVGFAAYAFVSNWLTLLRQESGTKKSGTEERVTRRGRLGAGSLSLHSLMDGIGMGLAFHVSAGVGLVVALGVLAHDFSDGINTVSLILKNGGTRKQAMGWLWLDAAAPVVGVSTTFFFSLPRTALGLTLAVFCGFFLYIGASDLVPESQHRHPALLTTLMMVLGMAVIYGAIQLASR